MDANNRLDSSDQLLNGDEVLTNAEKNLPMQYLNEQRVEPLEIQLTCKASDAVRMKLAVVDGQTPGEAGQVRVFNGASPAVAVLGPGPVGVPSAQTHELTASEKGVRTQKFWIEGIEAGELMLLIEKYNPATGEVSDRDTMRIEVNVDRGACKSPTSNPDVGDKDTHARHYAGASKSIPNLRGVEATFTDSREPLLTWNMRRVRNPITTSLWVGMATTSRALTGGIVPDQWAQIGLQARIKPGSPGTYPASKGTAVDPSHSFIYYELIGDGFQRLNQGVDRERIAYTKAPRYGIHEWKNGAAKIEYIAANVNVPRGDRLEASFDGKILVGGTLTGSGFPTGSQGLRGVAFDRFEVENESTASIVRVPGTPTKPAGVAPKYQTGTGSDIGAFQPANFTASDLRVAVFKSTYGMGPDPAANIRVVQGVSPAVLGHYKVSVDAEGQLFFSDRYEWEKPDPKEW